MLAMQLEAFVYKRSQHTLISANLGSHESGALGCVFVFGNRRKTELLPSENGESCQVQSHYEERTGLVSKNIM